MENPRIMLVDDNVQVLSTLKKVILKYLPEWEVFETTDPQEGLEWASREELDGILLDVQMPQMDGIEMCRRLKGKDETLSIPVILITGYESSPELRTRGLEAGALDFIHKPIDTLELVARLQVMVRIKRAEDELRRLNESLAHSVDEKVRELQESERKYRQIVELAREGIWLMDEGGYTQFVNPCMAKMLGYREEEMVGKHLFDFMAEEAQKTARINMEKRKEGREEEHEFELLRKDGSSVHTMMQTGPVFDEQRNYRGALAMVSDITEKKHLERQLLKSQKMEAVGQLAAGIAHDFNNLLQAIQGYIELTQMGGNLPVEAAENLNVAIQRCRSASALVQQILDFSRKSLLEKRKVDLSSVLDDFIDHYKKNLPGHFKISLQGPAGVLPIIGDRERIEQILDNLLTNAVESMPEGGAISLELKALEVTPEKSSVHHRIPPGKWACISLADSGRGILTDHKHKIFEPFFSTKPACEGRGLGLAQAYGLVKQHDGLIYFKSEVGKGTTFTLYFPVAE